MKDEKIIEYYPNGIIKHKIAYYTNGNKRFEQYYDKDGCDHRKNNLPDFQGWFQNGMLSRETYCRHGIYYNINGPTDICFSEDGKIWRKYYHLKKNWLTYTKLDWQSKIKNI